jgi:integrase
MKRPAARSSTIKFLTPDEMRRLFSVTESKRDQAIFLIAYRHGLRASEVGLLRDSDVDFKRMTDSDPTAQSKPQRRESDAAR